MVSLIIFLYYIVSPFPLKIESTHMINRNYGKRATD
jgi:hypothetical protein